MKIKPDRFLHKKPDDKIQFSVLTRSVEESYYGFPSYSTSNVGIGTLNSTF